MLKKIISIAWRYVLPVAVFALILLFTTLVQRLTGFSLDLTSLIIVLMIATAWYLGIGPGLLIAVIFELTLDYFSPSAYTGKALFITINRMVLFTSLVVFASSRRNAEKHLREQRELLQVTLASIDDAVIAADIDGKINFINPTAETLTGWTIEEAKGKPLDEVFQIVNEETRQSVDSPFSTVRRDGRAVGLANHTVLISKDGREIPIENSGAPIKDTEGEIVGVIIVFHDISKRRQREREREQLIKREQTARNEAETASRLKDEFLTTVSHELRTPMSAILGWSSILTKGQIDEKTIRKALVVIERNARAQAEIINDILDVSRIVTGKMQINSQPVEIAAIIRQAIETVRPAAIAKSVALTLSLVKIEGTIIGDSERLRQVVWNLVSNAVKFTPENGHVEISLKQADSCAEITVSDNGAGIDAEFLPYVFERFRQKDASSTREQGGLGLGLAIARNLIELHGGTIEATSEGVSKGATFTLRLPLSEKATELVSPNKDSLKESNAISADAPDIRGLRLLIVDDDNDTLEILRVVLKQYGAQVRIAVSSADALEVFHEWQPDVLISDIGMPFEDGYALISKIRSLPPERGGNIPAAALTAYVTEKDRHKALSAGYQIHIPKPVDPTAIAAAVAEIKKKI